MYLILNYVGIASRMQVNREPGPDITENQKRNTIVFSVLSNRTERLNEKERKRKNLIISAVCFKTDWIFEETVLF